jgi:hypothetical protein
MAGSRQACRAGVLEGCWHRPGRAGGNPTAARWQSARATPVGGDRSRRSDYHASFPAPSSAARHRRRSYLETPAERAVWGHHGCRSAHGVASWVGRGLLLQQQSHGRLTDSLSADAAGANGGA